MQCFHCKTVIDDDCVFCTECGEAVLECGKCGKIGKGKFCLDCGGALVRRADSQSAPAAPAAAAPVGADSAVLAQLQAKVAVLEKAAAAQTEKTEAAKAAFARGKALFKAWWEDDGDEDVFDNAITVFESIPIRLVKVDMHKALSISCKYSMYAYDAYYLETAYRLKLPLLTLDRGMKEKAKNMKINVLEVK